MVLGGGEGGQETLEMGGLRGPSRVGQDRIGGTGMGQWGSQGRRDGGQGTGTSARAGGSGRATAAGERWNPETWLQPQMDSPTPGNSPPMAPVQESLHPKSWVGLVSW